MPRIGLVDAFYSLERSKIPEDFFRRDNTGTVDVEDIFQNRRSLTFAVIREIPTTRHPKVNRLLSFQYKGNLDIDGNHITRVLELAWNIEGLVGIIKFGTKCFIVDRAESQIRATDEMELEEDDHEGQIFQ